jgi:hypothetical protein
MKAKGAVALARKLCGILLAMTKKKETFRGAAVVVEESSTGTKPVKRPRNKLQENATKSRRNLERAKNELAARTVVAAEKAHGATATAAAPQMPSETSSTRKTASAKPKHRPAAAVTDTRLGEGAVCDLQTASAVDGVGAPPPTRTFVLNPSTTTSNEHPHVRLA